MVLVLVAILFIVSIPFVSADTYPIDYKIEPNMMMTSSSYTLDEDDVFGVSVSISGCIDIQIEDGKGWDVATWRSVTGYFMGNMTIDKDGSYHIDFYNLVSNETAFVVGYILVNEYMTTNTTTTNTTTTTTTTIPKPPITFPFITTPTTEVNWLPDLSWLIPPLMFVVAAFIIVIIGCLCRGREENLHYLLNLEESLFGLPEEKTEE